MQNKELQAYNQTLAVSNKEDLAKGVIAIDGYEYVGYLRYSAKPELELFGEYFAGLESSIKKIIQLVRGQLIRIVRASVGKHRSQVMKARRLFNPQIQSTLAN
ncbi:MAG: hypothetical protein ACLVDO_08080 [Streptococcus thermophilus]